MPRAFRAQAARRAHGVSAPGLAGCDASWLSLDELTAVTTVFRVLAAVPSIPGRGPRAVPRFRVVPDLSPPPSPWGPRGASQGLSPYPTEVPASLLFGLAGVSQESCAFCVGEQRWDARGSVGRTAGQGACRVAVPPPPVPRSPRRRQSTESGFRVSLRQGVFVCFTFT